jgi:hypothetical protein
MKGTEIELYSFLTVTLDGSELVGLRLVWFNYREIISGNRLWGPQSQPGRFEEVKSLASAENGTPDRPASSFVTILTL